MTSSVRIIAERGSFRMIHCHTHGYAVIEMRDGYVYSLDPHHTGRARDGATGMREVATVTGWLSEADARRQLDDIAEAAQRLAKKMR